MGGGLDVEGASGEEVAHGSGVPAAAAAFANSSSGLAAAAPKGCQRAKVISRPVKALP